VTFFRGKVVNIALCCYGDGPGKSRDNTWSLYPEFLYTDTMLNQVAKDYYSDKNFCREFNGDISLWKVYNLLTASNKSSYIDLFLNRAANASAFVGELAQALEQGRDHWFLN
jgi:hypothetical protein